MSYLDDVVDEPFAPAQETAAEGGTAASYVLLVVRSVYRDDFELARWAAREAVVLRAKEAWETQ